MKRQLTFSHLLYLNQLVLTGILIAVLGVYGTHIYVSEQRAIRERIEPSLIREADRFNAELASLDANVTKLKGILDLFDVMPPEKRREKFKNFAATSIAPHPTQYNSFFALNKELSRKYFGTDSYVFVIFRDDKLIGTEKFHDPATFKSSTFTTYAYQGTPGEQWWTQNLKGPGVHYSDFYFDQGYMDRVMFSTTTGMYENGVLKAVVGIDTLVEDVARHVSDFKIGETGGMLIVDKHGRPVLPLISKDLSLIDHKYVKVSSPEGFKRMSQVSQKIFSTQDKLSEFKGANAKTYLTIARPLKGQSMFLVMYQEKGEAYSGLLFRLFLFTFVTIMTYLAFTAMLWISGRYVIAKNKAVLAELREAKDRAEEATKVKSSFLSTMSHEIRTPLNSMLGSAELLSETKLNSEQQALLRGLEGAGDTLLSMLNNVLDFSKFESGRMQLESREFLLSDLVRDVEHLVTPGVRSKGLQFIFEGPVYDRWIVGDSLRLKQVLINLLGNAIKFTERGSVQLSVQPYPGVSENREVFLFEVKYTGVGIAPENLGQVFDEFRQEDTSVTRRYGGTGLGLNISQKIVRQMGAELQCESQQYVGSRFYFSASLPSRRAELWSVRSPSMIIKNMESLGKLDAPSSESRVLIVDDMDENHMLLRAYLKRFENMVVDSAYDGFECLGMCEAHRYDLIFMDVQMPRLSGLDTIKKIREIEKMRETKRTPIVVISANSFAEDVEKSLGAGADEHCGKPIRKQTIIDLIQKYSAYREQSDSVRS